VRCPCTVSHVDREWLGHEVRVELVRSGGTRATESCAVGPDGYFFIPLDAPEDGRLAVRAPAGWFFTPPEAPARCGGEHGQESEFIFAGVGVEGVAACAGCAAGRGAANVTVTLGSDSATSDASGRFFFPAVAPGSHAMALRRGAWSQEARVSVSWEGRLAGHEGLVLPGFAVTGSATPGVRVTIGDQTAVADEVGEWRFDAVPAGE
jgi:hypothetical protein